MSSRSYIDKAPSKPDASPKMVSPEKIDEGKKDEIFKTNVEKYQRGDPIDPVSSCCYLLQDHLAQISTRQKLPYCQYIAKS